MPAMEEGLRLYVAADTAKQKVYGDALKQPERARTADGREHKLYTSVAASRSVTAADQDAWSASSYAKRDEVAGWRQTASSLRPAKADVIFASRRDEVRPALQFGSSRSRSNLAHSRRRTRADGNKRQFSFGFIPGY